MLDHFIWGEVSRISPEAPVPVVEFQRESYMPGGAANVARNLTALKVPASLFAVVGKDAHSGHLRELLRTHGINASGLLVDAARSTSVKTRIVAHKQQVVRIDRESRDGLDSTHTEQLFKAFAVALPQAAAVIVGDYGKGVISQSLLDQIKAICRERAIWLSLDPKPIHHLTLTGLSLITPNRKEAFELANLDDDSRNPDPFKDRQLMACAERLLKELRPAVLMITLGELGLLLCLRDQSPVHIPTVAKEVFDVSGAGDSVIATFTLAIAAGASPLEAAILSNHAAGIVVGKIGTATVSQDELLASFDQ